MLQLLALGYILGPIFAYNTWWLVLGYSFIMLLVGNYEACARPAYSYTVSPHAALVLHLIISIATSRCSSACNARATIVDQPQRHRPDRTEVPAWQVLHQLGLAREVLHHEIWKHYPSTSKVHAKVLQNLILGREIDTAPRTVLLLHPSTGMPQKALALIMASAQAHAEVRGSEPGLWGAIAKGLSEATDLPVWPHC